MPPRNDIPGDFCRWRHRYIPDVIEITADEPTEMTVGSPPNPTIDIQREGLVIRMNYTLKWANGDIYEERLSSDYSKEKGPQFAVYKGNKRIATGEFKYDNSDEEYYCTWVVPITAYGDLRFVAVNNVGDMGSTEGRAVIFYWSPIWQVCRALPWAILMLLMCLRENRNRKAWLIIFPLGIVVAVFSLLRYYSLVIPFVPALLLLYSSRINATKIVVIIIQVLVIFFLFYGLPFLSDMQPKDIVFIDLVASSLMLISSVLSGFSCRKKYCPEKYLIILFIWLALFSIGSLFCISIFEGELRLVSSAILGIIIAFVLYSILLPFMILTFASAFYRERFEAVFGFNKHIKSTEDAASQ